MLKLNPSTKLISMEMRLLDSFKKRVCLGILTKQSLVDTTDGRTFFKMLVSMVPQCVPVKYGNCEPIRRPFIDVDEAIAFWKHPFLWTCRSPKGSGSVWMNDSPRHTCIDFMLYGDNVPYLNLLQFLKDASLSFKADFAYLHTLTKSEVNSQSVYYAQWHPFDIGVTTNDLQKGLPNLPHMAVFGEPYVDMIGKSRLLNLPVGSSIELSNKLVYLQVEELSGSPIRDFDTFNEKRKLLKEYLGEEIFLDPSTNSKRIIPSF